MKKQKIDIHIFIDLKKRIKDIANEIDINEKIIFNSIWNKGYFFIEINPDNEKCDAEIRYADGAYWEYRNCKFRPRFIYFYRVCNSDKIHKNKVCKIHLKSFAKNKKKFNDCLIIKKYQKNEKSIKYGRQSSG